MSSFVIIPDGPFSLITAVNLLIGSMGEAPVDAIDPPPTSDVEIALQHLYAADLLTQQRGWSWNKELDYTLALDSDGRVPLPNNVLRVVSAYFASRQVVNVVARGLYLYDRLNHTNVFTEAVHVDMILRLSWDDLPPAARMFITCQAIETFQAAMTERSAVLSVNAKTKETAWTALQQAEDEAAQLNSVGDNISASTAIYGIGALRRNRAGY